MTCRFPLALGLLAVAAALPLAPLHAQQTETADDPPAAQAAAEDAGEPPAPDAPAAAAETPPPARRTAPTAPRPGPATPVVAVPPPTESGVYVPPPGPSPDAAAPAPASAPPTAYEPSPYVSPTDAPEILPEPGPVTVDRVDATTTQEGGGGSPLMWMLAGALAALALAGLFFLLRGRRRQAYAVEHRHAHTRYREPEPAPALPSAAPPAADPLAAAPRPAAPAPEPLATAIPVPAAAAAAPDSARPWIELALRPIRAGVTGTDARVEFELAVENEGSAPASEVRVSAAMFPAGAPATEMERLLVQGADESALPPTSIAPGAGKKITAAIEISTAEVEGDSLLPVIAAEARYRLPGGGEGRTVASFAIGVPDGDGLARFAIGGASGLHDDVVARPFGAAEKA